VAASSTRVFGAVCSLPGAGELEDAGRAWPGGWSALLPQTNRASELVRLPAEVAASTVVPHAECRVATLGSGQRVRLAIGRASGVAILRFARRSPRVVLNEPSGFRYGVTWLLLQILPQFLPQILPQISHQIFLLSSVGGLV
jgi:hypothetical protein